MLVRANGCRRTGGATVEMAVLAPLLIFIVVVGVDFARVYYFAQTVTNAARNGAMFATEHPDNVVNTSGIEAHALADATNLDPPPTVSSTTGNDEAGNPYVRVTVTWNFYTVVDYPGIPRPIVISRTVQMRVRPADPKEPVY